MMISFDSPMLIEGAITFPSWEFGTPPAESVPVLSPGQGGPLKETVLIDGSNTGGAVIIGGESDNPG